MRKVLLLIIIGFLSSKVHSQQIGTEVLSFSNNCANPANPAGGVIINTTLPFTGNWYMATVIFEGFNYGTGETIGLTISWHPWVSNGAGYFASPSLSSSGGYSPEVFLYNNNGKVSIFLKKGTNSNYCINFKVRSWVRQPNDGGDTSTWFKGWTGLSSDIAPLPTSAFTKFEYKNGFGEVKMVNGKLGIGTNSPSEKLELANGGDVGLRLFNTTANTWDIKNTNLGKLDFIRGGNQLYMRITQFGNIGIGSINPKNILDLGSATANRGISWGGEGANYANIWTKHSSSNLVLATGLYPPLNSTGFSSSYADAKLGKAAIELGAFTDPGDIIFYNNPASNVPVGQAFSPTESMRIKSNGNVGIGINNPSSKFQVENNLAQSIRFKNLYFSNTLEVASSFARSGIFNNAEYLRENGSNVWKLRNIGANDAAGMLFDNNGVIKFISVLSSGLVDRSLTHPDFASNTKMTILPSGNVGIGIINPQARLHVNSDLRLGGEYNTSSTLSFSPSQRTIWSVLNGQYASMAFDASEIVFHKNTTGGVAIGNVPIPTGYRLAVDGNVIAEKVKVKNSNAWPDFVFRKDYQLPSLSEIEKYVNENSHLPEMPSAAEIEKDGQDLGEMNRLLLKKVEELTLYLIDQNKHIEKQSKDILELKSLIKK